MSVDKDLLLLIISKGIGTGEPELGKMFMKTFLNVFL